MKKTNRALALLLALLMLCTGMSLSAFAAEPTVKLTVSGDKYEPSIDAIVETTGFSGNEEMNFTIVPNEGVKSKAMSGGMFFYNLAFDTEYTVTVTVEEGENKVEATGPFKTAAEPVITLTKDINHSTGVITVSAELKGFEDGTKPAFSVTATPEPSEAIMSEAKDFTFTISNFKYNTKYTVTAKATVAGKEISESIDVTPKTANPSKPGTPNVDTTSTTATFAAVAGAEYSVDGKNWQTNNNFIGLTPGTTYTFYIRYAETEQYRESEASTIIMKTLEAGKGEISAPVIEAVSKTSITVKADAADCEYSKDNGVNWQKSNVFTGLISGQEYQICRRYAGEAGVKENGPASPATAVKTNTKDAYIAQVADVSVTLSPEGSYKTGSAITAAVAGAGRTFGKDEKVEYQWGDINYVPISASVKCGEKTTNYAIEGGKFTFTPEEGGDCSVTVNFAKQMFVGDKFEYALEDGVVDVYSKTVTIKVAKQAEGILGLLQKLISLVTNTIPQLMYNFFHSIRTADFSSIIKSITG